MRKNNSDRFQLKLNSASVAAGSLFLARDDLETCRICSRAHYISTRVTFAHYQGGKGVTKEELRGIGGQQENTKILFIFF